MPRLSIDITEDEHRALKASAALKGCSIKDYVLERTLGGRATSDALTELTEVLRPRIEAADRGEVSDRSFKDIAQGRRKASRAKRKA